MGRRLIELPLWVLAATVITAGAIGGGTSAAIGCAVTWARGKRT